MKARHLSRLNIDKFLETFDAIKMIGKFFINCKNETSDNKDDVPKDSSLGEYTQYYLCLREAFNSIVELIIHNYKRTHIDFY